MVLSAVVEGLVVVLYVCKAKASGKHGLQLKGVQ